MRGKKPLEGAMWSMWWTPERRFWWLRNVRWRDWHPTFWQFRKFDFDDYLLSYDPGELEWVDEEHGLLVSSRCAPERNARRLHDDAPHLPLLDIDFPVRVEKGPFGDRLVFLREDVSPAPWDEIRRIAAMLGIGGPVSASPPVSMPHVYRENRESYPYPFLDLRVPYFLIPSSTLGHFHLYLYASLPWIQYRAFLEVLGAVGVLGSGYVRMSVKRQMTLLLKPGLTKATFHAHMRKMGRDAEDAS